MVNRYELVDWTPSKHPTMPVPSRMKPQERRNLAFLVNMELRKTGTTYIHNGGKP